MSDIDQKLLKDRSERAEANSGTFTSSDVSTSSARFQSISEKMRTEDVNHHSNDKKSAQSQHEQNLKIANSNMSAATSRADREFQSEIRSNESKAMFAIDQRAEEERMRIAEHQAKHGTNAINSGTFNFKGFLSK